MKLAPNHLYLAQTDAPTYDGRVDETFPELPEGVVCNTALCLLRTLLKDAALDAEHYGKAEWNPLGDLIKPGDKVLLKPNWVDDRNLLRDRSRECLVTHTSVIEAVLHYVLKARPGSVIVGDAPLQDCDFDQLRAKCKLDEMVKRFKQLGHEIQIRDFRLTKKTGLYNNSIKVEHQPENYCLFDLGQRSWLNDITNSDTEFRVTKFNPEVLKQHHNRENHQYLVTRAVIDADVVISLPKLKTHQKAGVTGALKNIVGINGFKEYLPHHRKGGSQSGGDCYVGGGQLKRMAEDALDRANRSNQRWKKFCNVRFSGLATRLNNMLFGQDRDLGGAWHGNDTVWRMCLDLQRILHYGKGDGELSDTMQRKVITITDAIVAGEGNGPLWPTPLPLGVMTLGGNVAAVEWVHCLLMGMDPEKIPLVVNAFAHDAWPLVDFTPDKLKVWANGEALKDLSSVAKFARTFTPSPGWLGHCEKVV